LFGKTPQVPPKTFTLWLHFDSESEHLLTFCPIVITSPLNLMGGGIALHDPLNPPESRGISTGLLADVRLLTAAHLHSFQTDTHMD
jgi:hypothetical protein